jgi:hypothetical protein
MKSQLIKWNFFLQISKGTSGESNLACGIVTDRLPLIFQYENKLFGHFKNNIVYQGPST